jgi:hypothetical protein
MALLNFILCMIETIARIYLQVLMAIIGAIGSAIRRVIADWYAAKLAPSRNRPSVPCSTPPAGRRTSPGRAKRRSLPRRYQ